MIPDCVNTRAHTAGHKVKKFRSCRVATNQDIFNF